MADIFISYSKQEPELTLPLAHMLERLGYTTWWDTSLTAGESFGERIIDEINKAKAVVVIWTAASIRSEWVQAEAQWAAAKNKLITVRSKDLDPDEIPPPFNNRHTVLVTEYEKIFEALLQFTTLHSFDQRSSVPDEQEPGIQFVPQEDGKIHLTPSGFASADDVTEILTMRGVIIETLDDLAVLLDGSNAYKSIATVAQRYKTAISAIELSVDLLYAYGVRLENSRARLAIEIKSGDFPDLAVPAGEALDSVIALHGPVIYSTARGKELIERARSFAADGLDVAEYKKAAQQVAAAIDNAEDMATELARETIKQASDEIGEGKHPERSTHVARTTLGNFMIAAAKGVQKALTPEVMTETMTKGAYMAATTAAVYAAYTTTPALWAFFITNKALLYDFSMAAGCELSWLPSFLNWLEKLKQQVRLSI